LKFLDLAAEGLVAPLYRVLHLASSLLHAGVSVAVLSVHQLALPIGGSWLLPHSTLRVVQSGPRFFGDLGLLWRAFYLLHDGVVVHSGVRLQLQHLVILPKGTYLLP
jgi:hypothetical protein